jgi:pimeloyl-ACP methyl ester carboxylesterase
MRILRRKSILGLIVLGAAMMGAAAISGGPWPGRSLQDQARVSEAPCWFEIPSDFAATCYRFPVQERRGSPGTLMLRIPVVVLSMPKKHSRGDPTVFLAGGPGDGAWIEGDRMDYWWRFMRYGTWVNQGELILVDQRGTGGVEPRMDCPEIEVLTPSLLGTSDDALDGTKRMIDATRDCYHRVLREGHDPNAYRTRDSAEDLHELRVALGIRQWNVYGVSYGTRLALTYIREHPDDFRSVILDSVYPPQIDFYGEKVWQMQRVFDAVFDACETDNACRAWYPNLPSRLLKLVSRLNVAPIDFDVDAAGDSGSTSVHLTGDLLLY